MNTKQVLVWRKDLRTVDGHKVRSGKMAAQLAHASMKAILDAGSFEDFEWGQDDTDRVFELQLTPEMRDWMEGLFTKICVSVDSEEELLAIYKHAQDVGVLCSLIQDAGLTEFGGVPTYTAVAIGPADAEDVDPITSELKLL